MDQQSKRSRKSTASGDKKKKPKQTLIRKGSSGKTVKKKEDGTKRSKPLARKPPPISSADTQLSFFEDLGARIAKRAYELYEQRGRQHGHDWDDRIEAERQIYMANN
jgi:hypothetical protein